MTEGIRERARERFGNGKGIETIAFAPGRVNLIGEHTDYNLGYSLPFGIREGVTVWARRRTDATVVVRSAAFPGEGRFDLTREATLGGAPAWIRYPLGMAAEMRASGLGVPGADLWIESDLAVGQGLSSSAALLLATGAALAGVAGLWDRGESVRTRLARLARDAENRHAGVPCGPLDPFAIAFAEAGSVLLFDARTETVRRIPWELRDAELFVLDPGVPRRLAESGYAKRRAECEAAARLLHRCACRVRSLSDVTPRLLAARMPTLPPALYRRAKHVVEENARTLRCAQAVEAGDAAEIGRLLSASHRSLKDLFECSVPAIDFLVDRLASLEDVYGARLVGGGFGGSVLVLARSGSHDRWLPEVRQGYRERYSTDARLVPVSPAGGIRVEAGGGTSDVLY